MMASIYISHYFIMKCTAAVSAAHQLLQDDANPSESLRVGFSAHTSRKMRSAPSSAALIALLLELTKQPTSPPCCSSRLATTAGTPVHSNCRESKAVQQGAAVAYIGEMLQLTDQGCIVLLHYHWPRSSTCKNSIANIIIDFMI